MTRWLMTLMLALLIPSLAQATTVTGVPRVVDGDTLVIQGERIRLHGMNAVESKQMCGDAGEQWACGQAATQAMARAVGGAPVQCQGQERDPYGRLVAKCWNQQGEDLSARMVDEGWAVAYRRYSMDYVQNEAHAKARGEGVWSGDFTDPENYRHGGSGMNSVSALPRSASSVVGALTGFLGLQGAASPQAVVSDDERPHAASEERSGSALDLASDRFPQGDRVRGTGQLNGRQYCALVSLLNRDCR